MAADPRGRPGRQGRAGRLRPDRLAQDVRARAACTSTPGSSRAGRFTRGPPRRRRAGREIERRAPTLATAKWWKEERHGVFVDYNQNAKDRTVASAYSIRPTPDARVSTPLAWSEVPGCDPEAFTIGTVPERFAAARRPVAGRWTARQARWRPCSPWPTRTRRPGSPDAPWPPHYDKQAGEPPRVQPSKRRAAAGASPPARARPGGPTGRRRSSMPLIEVARAASRDGGAWRAWSGGSSGTPSVWPLLEPADMLVDTMRGRSSTWTRIRLNLRHVPEAEPAAAGGAGSRL